MVRVEEYVNNIFIPYTRENVGEEVVIRTLLNRLMETTEDVGCICTYLLFI